MPENIFIFIFSQVSQHFNQNFPECWKYKEMKSFYKNAFKVDKMIGIRINGRQFQENSISLLVII